MIVKTLFVVVLAMALAEAKVPRAISRADKVELGLLVGNLTGLAELRKAALTRVDEMTGRIVKYLQSLFEYDELLLRAQDLFINATSLINTQDPKAKDKAEAIATELDKMVKASEILLIRLSEESEDLPFKFTDETVVEVVGIAFDNSEKRVQDIMPIMFDILTQFQGDSINPDNLRSENSF